MRGKIIIKKYFSMTLTTIDDVSKIVNFGEDDLTDGTEGEEKEESLGLESEELGAEDEVAEEEESELGKELEEDTDEEDETEE
jgi:hypothetical protein